MSSCCFFNDTATTEIYTLSLHDALPICRGRDCRGRRRRRGRTDAGRGRLVRIGRRLEAGAPARARPNDVSLQEASVVRRRPDRKSTRLNSSHGYISYAVFCLKKKKKTKR